MPDPVKFFRVTTLPPVPEVDSVYYVFDGINTETYIVGNDGIARRDFGQHSTFILTSAFQTLVSGMWTLLSFQSTKTIGAPNANVSGMSPYEEVTFFVEKAVEISFELDIVTTGILTPFSQVVSSIDVDCYLNGIPLGEKTFTLDGWSHAAYIRPKWFIDVSAGDSISFYVRVNSADCEVLFGTVVLK